MICIVDYGVGNIQAFINMFKQLNIEILRATNPSELSGATYLILPGVGHFDYAMQRFNDSGMRSKIERMVLNDSVPLVGVCVGMQMLSEGSDEGDLPGLNWVPGRVHSLKVNAKARDLPMPHMGWNDVQPIFGTPLFSKGFSEIPQFYFLHSFYFQANDRADVAATSNYGLDFDAVVSRGNIHGIQCHPEKSHHWGAQFFKNFVEL